MFIKLAQLLYWLSIIFAISLAATAIALALDLDETDGFELYIVCTAMIAAAAGMILASRALYRMAQEGTPPKASRNERKQA
jgi:hypothetical protein